MMKFLTPIKSLIQTASSIREFRLVTRQSLEDAVNIIESLQSSSSGGQWVSAAEASVSGDARWRRSKQNTLSAWAADPAIARAVQIYARWCLAGGVRVAKHKERGWSAGTMNRLFPNGLFQFITDYIFHYFVYGELFFAPKFNEMGVIDSFELFSPLDVLDIRQDTYDQKIYFTRRWIAERVGISADNMTLDSRKESMQRAYSSDDVCVIKWNSTDNRGMPFLFPVIVWAAMYAEWLKDRAVTNNMRSFAYLKRKINQHGGVAKKKSDQFSSQLMKASSYVAGRSDQYGYGLRRQKMPKGGILTCSMDEDWEALNFPIQGDDASPDGHAMRQQICALTGIPEALLFTDDRAKLDISDARVESFSRDIEFVRSMLNFHLDGILEHCRDLELRTSERTGRSVSTSANLQFKPAAVGERRFYTEDAIIAMKSGQMSRRTAMEMNPNVTDPDVEEARIRDERKDGITEEFLDRIAPITSDREDEDNDLKNKQKESASGKRKQEHSQSKKTGEET
jgi:hypothetical protein